MITHRTSHTSNGTHVVLCRRQSEYLPVDTTKTSCSISSWGNTENSLPWVAWLTVQHAFVNSWTCIRNLKILPVSNSRYLPQYCYTTSPLISRLEQMFSNKATKAWHSQDPRSRHIFLEVMENESEILQAEARTFEWKITNLDQWDYPSL